MTSISYRTFYRFAHIACREARIDKLCGYYTFGNLTESDENEIRSDSRWTQMLSVLVDYMSKEEAEENIKEIEELYDNNMFLDGDVQDALSYYHSYAVEYKSTHPMWKW